MSTPTGTPNNDALLARPFPTPGQRMLVAYRELQLAITGTPTQRDALGDPALLPRPWLPGNCTDPALRAELWQWLDDVADWLNHQYVWDPDTGIIPPCWPAHPHLVHELAVLADQRWQAERHPTSDAIEDWHRYNLPMFTDRMRRRLRDHCTETHEPTPARPSRARHIHPAAAQARVEAFTGDIHVTPTHSYRTQ